MWTGVGLFWRRDGAELWLPICSHRSMSWYRPLVDRQPFEEFHGMFWTRPGGHSSPHPLSSVLA